jgi:HD-GYP domain-containing protein (c-di-GMP phosphodiesterase class II)
MEATAALRDAGTAADPVNMTETYPPRLSELLSALSCALDLSEGEPYGHAARSCLIATRLGGALALSPEMLESLYYAVLLKDAGGSATAAGLADLFACDDLTIKQDLRVSDWARRLEFAQVAARAAQRDEPFPGRVRRVVKIALAGPRGLGQLMRTRGERGAAIARRLGLSEAAAGAIRNLNEHWDGRGLPDGSRGEAIPLLARIALLAQTVDAVHVRHGLDAAFGVARRRRATWFDPILVDALWTLRDDRDWWEGLLHDDLVAKVAAAEPEDRICYLGDSGIDDVAAAFAEVIEAKTSFTQGNAGEVAELSVALARSCGIGRAGQRRAHRAALLHDIGTLGVSHRILAKPGPLTPDEHKAIERHPIDTWEILSRAPALEDVAAVAAAHHERLDGSGYPKSLTSKELDLSSRILAVADVYVALISTRPYRPAIPPDVALALLRSDADEGRFDPRMVRALSRLLVETPSLVPVS